MRRLINPLNCIRKYRFVTPSRSGKWYSDITEAQRNSMRLGAGFYDEKNGQFFAYPGTRLETYDVYDDEAERRPAFAFGTADTAST